MKSKMLLILSSVITIIVVGYLIKTEAKPAGIRSIISSQVSTSATTTPITKWNTYINTQFNYTLQYPSNALIQIAQEEERLSVEKSLMVEIAGQPDVHITISAEPLSYISTSTKEVLYKKADLESFARAVWQREIDDKNPNFPHRKVSDLKEVMFAGHKAYTGTTTDYLLQGYGYPNGANALFAETGNALLIIQYGAKSKLSQQIVDSIKLEAAPLSPVIQWLTYKNTRYGYQIKYPEESYGPQNLNYPPTNTSEASEVTLLTPRGELRVMAIDERVRGFYERTLTKNNVPQVTASDTKSFADATRAKQQELYNHYTRNIPKVGSLGKKEVSGVSAYSFILTGQLNALPAVLLVPSPYELYEYTFIQNKQGTMFIFWYPANDPFFQQMMDTFEFTQ